MPLLKKEIDLWPDDLFERVTETRPWRVAHVKSRQEKVLARHCREQGIAFYLPQAERTTRRSGRTFRSYVPLFPGYVFVRAANEDLVTVFRTAVVANLLPVEDQAQLGNELHQIHELQQSGAMFVPHAWVGPGDAVRITEGVFSGYSGVVLRERGEMQLVVSVSTLQRSFVAELPRDAIVPASAR